MLTLHFAPNSACIMSQRLGIITEEAFPLLSAYAARLLARPACAKAFSA